MFGTGVRPAGYLTVSAVAKALGIGTTTLRRREGTVYPRAVRIGGFRVYHEVDVERLRRRDKVPPRLDGGDSLARPGSMGLGSNSDISD
jgi:hypothetical protein